MDNFLKNVLKLTLGNIAAQVISLAAVPVITRIYHPENYGVFATYLSITVILFPVSTLRFNSAMMLPESLDDAANLLALSLLSVMGISLLITIGIVVANVGNFLPMTWVEKGLDDYLWLVPIGVFVQGSALSIVFWALRHKMFGDMARARITESIADRGVVLAIGGFTNFGALGLIAGRIIGPFLALCFLLQKTLIHDIKAIRQILSMSAMVRLARRYREFHLFSSVSFFVNNCGRETPLLLLAAFFSPLEIGFYALAGRVINMPMMLIGDAVSKVFLQRATGDKEKGEDLKNDTKILIGYMIYLAFPLVLLLLFFGKEVFEVVFGAEWTDAGLYAQILALSFFCLFLYRPLSTLFDAFERQRQRFTFDMFLLLGRIGAIMLGIYIGGSVPLALLALTIITCIMYAIGYVYLFGLVGVDVWEMGSIFICKLAIMFPLIVGISLPVLFLQNHFLASMMIVVLFLFFQGIIILRYDPNLKNQLMRITPYLKRKAAGNPFVNS